MDELETAIGSDTAKSEPQGHERLRLCSVISHPLDKSPPRLSVVVRASRRVGEAIQAWRMDQVESWWERASNLEEIVA